MNSLVCHPAPFSTESFLGYILRLSQLNGYESPWSLFSLAGMRQHEIRTTGIRCDRLAAIANRNISELNAIAYSGPQGNPRRCRILDHPIVLADLSLHSPKLCSQCVSQRGFIEAHWDLTLMTACPIHQSMLTSHCSKCAKPLRWFRPGILECECGGNLTQGDQPVATRELADLMAVIRAKILRKQTGIENFSGLPLAELFAMDLRAMLSVIRTVGKSRLRADDQDANDPVMISSAASAVFANWPRHFIQLLLDIGNNLPVDGRGNVRGQFQRIYGSLFKNKAIATPKQLDFLRAAFLEFVTRHWDRGFVDHKLLKALNATAATKKRFLTQTEFASRFGVQQSTAARFLNKQRVASIRIRVGRSPRVLIDREQLTVPKTIPGTIYRAREAAKMLGLSVSLLQALKEVGIYEIKNTLRTRAGYHERDIASLTQRLLSLAEAEDLHSTESVEVISLREIVRNPHDSTEIKVSVVQSMISRDLNVIGNADGSTGGLLIGRKAYQTFVESVRVRAAGGASTPSQAAKALLCDTAAISGLIEMGLLEGSKVPTGLRITNTSIERFNLSFVSLASIARELRTSSRALMRRCAANGIEILLASAKRSCGPQPFIRVSDRSRLLFDRTIKDDCCDLPRQLYRRGYTAEHGRGELSIGLGQSIGVDA